MVGNTGHDTAQVDHDRGADQPEIVQVGLGVRGSGGQIDSRSTHLGAVLTGIVHWQGSCCT